MLKNVDLEYSVLACLMIDEECTYDIDKINENDFTDTFAIETFKTIKDLYRENKSIDYLSINTKNPNIDISHLLDLSELLPGTMNFKTYLKDLKELTNRRLLIKAADSIKDLALKGESNILDESERIILDIRDSNTKGNMSSVKEIAVDVYEDMVAEIDNPYKLTGFDTGFRSLNRFLNGLNIGYNVLAARPSMGKTTLGLNIAMNLAEQGKQVVIFTLEDTKKKIVRRLALSKMSITMNGIKRKYELFKQNKISKKEYDESKLRFNKILNNTMNYIYNLSIHVDDTSGVTAEYIRSECRRIKQKTKKDIDMIMVDYIQLMDGPGKDAYAKTSYISKAIQGIYKEFNCPFLAISQLSRAVESRSDKRPVMSDLRESGQIEQDATTIMFVYRDYYYDPDNADEHEAEIDIKKNKDGTTGKIKMDCDLESFKFYNYGESIRRNRN